MHRVALLLIQLRSLAWILVLAGLTGFTAWHRTYAAALADARLAFEGQADAAPKPTWLNHISDLVSGTQTRTGKPRARPERSTSVSEPDYHFALRRALDHLLLHPNDPVGNRLAALCLSRLDYAAEAEPYYALARANGRLSPEDLHAGPSA